MQCAEAVLATKAGGSVLHETKNVRAVTEASMVSESIASGRAGEISEICYYIDAALGVAPKRPVVILSDSLANVHVASAAPTRMPDAQRT